MVLPPRYAIDTPTQRNNPHKAPNPRGLQAMRLIFTLLVCASALACAIMACIIVHYFVSHKPIILPSWGSLLFILFMGFFTPILYFGYYLFLPSLSFVRRGTFIHGLFTMKLELIFQFAMCAIWISGALAYANDFRGHENCIWDGYYYYPKPSNWNHLCDMVNWLVALCYTTFGLQAGFFAAELFVITYIFLFIDQDTLNEPLYSWGKRGYDYQHQPPAPISSFNQPMAYRASAGSKAPRHMSYPGSISSHEKGGYYEGPYEREMVLRDGSRLVTSDESSSALHSGSSGSTATWSRRGPGYADHPATHSGRTSTLGSESSEADSSTAASESRYYGGAYANQSVNSRRAGLTDTPVPAGAGGTSSAPAWSAPTITSSSDSSTDRASTGRRVSAPVSLGSRGRRGAAYSIHDTDSEAFGYSDAEEPDTSADLRSRPLGRSASMSARARRASDTPRRRAESDEESGWHLREEDDE